MNKHEEYKQDQLIHAWAADMETTPHPSNETLTAYAIGELSPSETDELLLHVSQCKLCSSILLEIGDISDSESWPLIKTDKKELEHGLEKLGITKDEPEYVSFLTIFSTWLNRYPPVIIPAFTLLLGLILGKSITYQEIIHTDIPIMDLYSDKDIERGLGSSSLIFEDHFTVFILNPPGKVDSTSTYYVKIYNHVGNLISTQKLLPNSSGNFTLAMPQKFLSESKEITLHDEQDQKVIAKYTLKRNPD